MKPASFWDWVGPACLMSAFIAYLYLSTPSEFVLCRGNEDCFREWVGALSGWAAAAAAAATIYTLYDQLKEQKRQTDFILGDADPTFDAMEDEDEMYTVALRIVNWNRRALLIESVEVVGDQGFNLDLVDAEVSQRDVQTLYSETVFHPPMRCNGWEDRSGPPARAKVRLRAFRASRHRSSPGLQDITLRVTCRLLGERHKPLTLTASTSFITF